MEAGVTTATTASFSSIIGKPLSQLTEEDISQLTREDCRKFLKEKGMRRPSWNKSQAIQQVISLKALLESNDDSGTGTLRKIFVSPPPPSVPPENATAQKMTEYQQQFRDKGNIFRDSDVDGQVNRKVSLQRYLEKRKDRGRFLKDRKNTGQTSSSLEIYLNHQIRTHNSNGQSSRSSTSSPPESGLPHAQLTTKQNL